MSNQAEHEHEPSQTLTPEELRQSLLSQIDATKEAVYALSDEEVEQIAGGLKGGSMMDSLKTIYWQKKPNPQLMPGPQIQLPGHERPAYFPR